jgi:TonB family protein
MNALVIYMFKAALYLTAFYLIYFIFLSRDTSYARNRAYILFSLTVAMILPYITLHNFRLFDLQFFGKYLSEVFVTASGDAAQKSNSVPPHLSVVNLAFSIYLAGVAIFVLKLIVDLINLLFLILKQKDKGSRIIRFHGFKTAGFSAMGYVFINTRLNPDEAAEIIKHEQNHLKRNHFVDIIFIEIIKAFQWFNPAVYLFNRSLRAIHEYQADQECLTSGVAVLSYQTLLLNQVFRTNTFTLTNSFSNPSLIKKRMIMMTKKPTASIANMKLLVVVPVTAVIFLTVSSQGDVTKMPGINSDNSLNRQQATGNNASVTIPSATTGVSQTNNPINPEEEPFVVVEQMPEFPGGDVALLAYLASHTNYPEKSKTDMIEGRVILRFCVAADGSVNRISVLKGVAPELDEEAMRVVSTLPAFKPGVQSGKTVPVWYMVPITFTLK